MHDLASWPEEIDGATVRDMIQALSVRPTRPLFDVDGQPVPDATIDALMRNLAVDAIGDDMRTVRWGMVLERAPLRTFPTDLRVFSRPGETDIDRFQESALFPGTPVLMLKQSGDARWEFVVSPRYAAWIPSKAVAMGSREEILAYTQRRPYRVVTGAEIETVYTREAPQVSALQLDMGVRVPLADVPANAPVNGQHPYTGWVVDLPVHGYEDFLDFQPAIIPRIADTSADYLPLTRANLIRQAFKFLGERYGWGHSYDARDCSGFVSEVYRSMGVQLPRNTSDQAVSPVFARRIIAAPRNRIADVRASSTRPSPSPPTRRRRSSRVTGTPRPARWRASTRSSAPAPTGCSRRGSTRWTPIRPCARSGPATASRAATRSGAWAPPAARAARRCTSSCAATATP